MRNIFLTWMIFGLVGSCFGWENEAKPWQKLEGCRIVESYGNDGDSFHVRHGDKEYVFRLCFVDCPESSMSYPERVREQGKWWGISDEDVVKAGKDATEFTMKLLKDKPFTVYTKFKDARGQSKLGREFVMIKVGDKWLSERLVAAGLARSYGYTVDTPDGISRRDYRARLDRLESEAKTVGRGAWGYARKSHGSSGNGADSDSGRVRRGYEVTLPHAVKMYGADNRVIAIIPAGSTLRVLDQSGRWRIKASVNLQGECDREALQNLLKK